MGVSTNTAMHGMGQSNFDTFDLTVVNNGSSFVVGAPIGGVMPYAASYSQHSATPPYPPPNDTPARLAMPVYASQSISNVQIRLTGNGSVSNPSVEVDYYFMYGPSLASLAVGQTIVRMPYGAGFPSQPLGLVYEDIQNVELIPAGDVAAYCAGFTGAGATGGICAPTVNWQTDFTNGISIPLSSSVNKNSLPYVPINIHLNSREWISAVGEFFNNVGHPGQAQQLMPTSGTWSNLTIQLDGSSYTADAYTRTFTSFHGSGFYVTDPGGGGMPYGHQIISIAGLPASQPSKAFPVSNPQNVDLVSKNDFIGVEYNCATNTQATYYMGLTSLFTPTDPNTTPFMTGGEPTNTNNNPALSFQQIAPGGGQARMAPGSTSEAMAIAVVSGTFSNLTVSCDTVGTGATGAFYINNVTDKGTPQAIHQVLSFSGTGKTQTDPQNVDLITAGMAYCNTLTGFTNTYSLVSQAVAFQSVGPASGGAEMLLLNAA